MKTKEKVLISDVGGTNVRFGIYEDGQTELVTFDKKYKCRDVASFEDAVGRYLAEKNIKPALCIVGAAGAIDLEIKEVLFTNTPWKASIPKLKEKFSFIKQGELYNDFLLQGKSLSKLTKEQYRPIFGNEHPDLTRGNIIVAGPGTGLGICLITQDGNGNQKLITSEGGHINIPSISFENEPDNLDNKKLLDGLAAFYETPVAENIISGTGISNMYHIFKDGFIPKDVNLKVPAEQVEQLAQANDATALKAFKFFNAYLGAHAGSMASTLIANQVFFCGGLMASPWVTKQLEESKEFKKFFEERAGMTSTMKNMRFSASTFRDMATLGAMAYAQDLIDTYHTDMANRKNTQDIINSLYILKGVVEANFPELKKQMNRFERLVKRRYNVNTPKNHQR